jgi:hypothetical protein
MTHLPAGAAKPLSVHVSMLSDYRTLVKNGKAGRERGRPTLLRCRPNALRAKRVDTRLCRTRIETMASVNPETKGTC